MFIFREWGNLKVFFDGGSLLEMSAKRRSKAFYKSIDVDSMANALRESVFSRGILWMYVNSFINSKQRWTSNKIIKKALTLSKYGDIMLNSTSQTRAKCDSLALSRADFWMIMRCAILCFYFYFLFRTNSKREQLHKNDFGYYYVNFFKRAILKVLDHRHVQSFFSKFTRHCQRHLRDTLQLKVLRTWINIDGNSFSSKYFETKVDESVWKIISRKKIRAYSSKNIAPRHFNYYFMLLFFNLNKPNF